MLVRVAGPVVDTLLVTSHRDYINGLLYLQVERLQMKACVCLGIKIIPCVSFRFEL